MFLEFQSLRTVFTSVERLELKLIPEMSAEWKVEIRFLSSTEKDNPSINPRIEMLIPDLLFQGKDLTRPMGWVLHTCTYVGNLPIDIPLSSKLTLTVGCLRNPGKHS